MGGATTAGFAVRHPEMTKAALICNIDAGQQPSDAVADREAAETRRRGLEFVRGRGLADYARQQIAAKTVPRFILESEEEQQRFVTRYAHQPLHGYLGVGEALPWREAWLTEAAQSLRMPVAIMAGAEGGLYRGGGGVPQRLSQAHFLSLQDAPPHLMKSP